MFLTSTYLFYVLFLDTDEEVVNNLPGGLKTIVNLILVVKALLSYPLPYYATCEILEKELFRGKPDTQFPTIWSVDGELKVWGLGKVIYPKYYENLNESCTFVAFVPIWSSAILISYHNFEVVFSSFHF